MAEIEEKQVDKNAYSGFIVISENLVNTLGEHLSLTRVGRVLIKEINETSRPLNIEELEYLNEKVKNNIEKEHIIDPDLSEGEKVDEDPNKKKEQ